MEGVWSGRWDPTKNGAGSGGDQKGHTRNRSRSGDNPRCAVCLEEVGTVAASSSEKAGSELCGVEAKGLVPPATSYWTADIGSEEARLAGAESTHANDSFAYLPCGHRFHTHW